MRTSSYKRGGAFILTLVLMFTTLFGGLGSLGINGVIEEAYAGTGLVKLENSSGDFVDNYETLADALTAAENGYTITLLGDVTETAAYIFDTTGKTITISGGGFTVTGLDGVSSSALVLSGTGTVKLQNIKLQGGTASTAYSGISTGLKLVGGTNVQSIGTVECFGGISEGYSYGVWNTSTGTGTVNVTNATGGTANNSGYSCGVRNDGSGTINVIEAKGATVNVQSMGVYNTSNGIVNVTNATGGKVTGHSSYGVLSGGTGVVNVENATYVSSNWYPYGVYISNGTVNVTNIIGANAISEHGGTVNLGTSTGTVDLNGSGTVNTGLAVTTLTLNKDSGEFCVLDSITIATAGNTEIGALPEVSSGGSIGAWYTDIDKTTPFVGTTVNIGTSLYSTLYTPTYTMSSSTLTTFASQTAGYGTAPALQTVTITNTGDQQITLTQPTSTNYDIGTLSSITLPVSGTVTFTVQPNTGLAVGSYNETINILGPDSASTSVSAQFAVTVAPSTLAFAQVGPISKLATDANFTNLATGAGSGSITYASGTPATATVNASTGEVTIVATGTTIITATQVASATHAEGTATYTINVTAAASTSTGTSGSSGGGSSATPIINTNTGSVTGDQLNTASGAAKNGETVTINSNKNNEVTFPASGLGSLAGKDNSLTVVTEKGTLTFDSKAVASMGTQATAEDIQVIVDNVDKTILTDEQQAKVGDKVVYDLTVMSGGTLISSFNGGTVNVSIPYLVEEGQSTDDITVWYMADDGSLAEIKCVYDANTKSVTFVVDHFSKYIIGYVDGSTWVNSFKDVLSGAWFYEAVAYVNSRDLMKGQTEITFAPQAAMTRGMFVTILGRMEGVDTTMYASSNTFSDVDKNQYYSPYIEWASDKSIVNGMGQDKFAPNASVTREQMAVIMTNYMKYKGQGPEGLWAIQLKYGDIEMVSSWASEGLMFMTMKGLMKGMGNDADGNPLFAPKLTSNRAQTAQLMMNLQEFVN